MTAEARIIDAAANRAREALRVMEDIARFGLDDPSLSAVLKTLRHDIRSGLESLHAAGVTAAALSDSRDTPGDVGTTISAPGEGQRRDLADVAAAAGSRLTEALRTLEEVAKVIGQDGAPYSAWQVFESARYRAYDAQKRLAAALAPPVRQWRLCVLITEVLCTHHSWETVARRAISAGADCVQLREKALDSGELLRRARVLVEIARPRGAAVIVNDRPDIALLSGADGVHLGQTDLSIADVRRLGTRPTRRLLVGVSCSTLEQARAAAESGADYLGLGPMFVSTTKAKPTLAGPGLIEAVAADPLASRLPHLAISGITPANIGVLIAAGCRGIAVSGAVCGAEDVEAAVAGLIGG